jgi:hypothetical protein
MRKHNRQPSTLSAAPPSPVPWWYTLFAGPPSWRVRAWAFLFVTAEWAGFSHKNWPRPLIIVPVLLVVMCWLAINASLVMHVIAQVPFRPAWAKPALVAAIICLTAATALPAVSQLWADYSSSTVLIIYAALQGLALVFFVVSTVSVAVRSR